MALHPNGVNHLAISTCDIKGQIEFFTDVLGAELKALYWMHGVENTIHGFVELSPECYVAFVQHPENTPTVQLGTTHAGNAGGPVAAGTMQHVAFNVNTLDDLLALRDRIRDRGVPVLGPIDHGLCQSMYFAGPEGLSLEVACGGGIDDRAWIDPEVVAIAGIDDDELERFRRPADYTRPATPVAQPTDPAPGVPQLAYPPAVWKRLLALPDEALWHSVTNEPPVKVGDETAAAG
jgi:catechol 2,3-dioxygenase-like lactoylglutathione lyase family enzyme